jgi:aerobic-type carbon monoxide dehydrogenase small subunit (CoxS/CutS family)
MQVASDEQVAVTVNGKPQTLNASPDRSLLEVLREDLGLTGTRDGCSGAGDCGSCAILVEGRRTLACRTAVSDVAEKKLMTIEGLASGEQLHPAQQVFLDDNAFQCGFCTAGMIMSLVGHLQETPNLDDAALLAKMDANLCRCCGYARIASAIKRAAAAIREANGGAR